MELTAESNIRKRTEYAVSAVIFVLTLYVLHPIIHEFGHALAAVLLGMKVESIQIYPEFITSVTIEGTSAAVYFIIAIGGLLLPFAVSCLRSDSLPADAFIIPLRAMVMVTAIGELKCIGEYAAGRPNAKSDMVNVLTATDIPFAFVVIALLFLIAAATWLFIAGLIRMTKRMT